MPKPRGATSYRLSSDAQCLLTRMASQMGLTKTAVLELAIRKLGHAELREPTGPHVAAAPSPAASVDLEAGDVFPRRPARGL
jgi:hypothetical protein